MSLIGLSHVLVALTTATMAWLVARARRGPRSTPGAAWLVVALCTVTLWSAHLAWYWLLGASSSQVLWLPAVGATFGATLAWSVTLQRPAAAGVGVLLAICLVDPVLLVAAHLVLGPTSVVVRTDTTIEYGGVYSVHVLLVLAMLIVTASLWWGCRRDPSRTVRLLAITVVGGLLAAGALDALQLRLMNVAMAVMLVAVATVLVRADASSVRVRPEAGPLLDDLGALVLVLDRDERLVDLNAPARAFFAQTPSGSPAMGTALRDLLPVSIAQATDGVAVRLESGGGPADFVCFAARLSTSTSPPEGSIVVLRSSAAATWDLASTKAPSPTVPGPGDMTGFEDEVGELAAESDALVSLGVRFECQDDATRAAHAVEFVVGSLGGVRICRLDERTLLVVAPAQLEPILVDVASAWQSRASAGEAGDDQPPRSVSVSLAPVLAGDLVVRRGPSLQASSLLATVREALSATGP